MKLFLALSLMMFSFHAKAAKPGFDVEAFEKEDLKAEEEVSSAGTRRAIASVKKEPLPYPEVELNEFRSETYQVSEAAE